MDPYVAAVLRTILQHAPCTKLCVKQHSGLAMSTVLRGVEQLQREGWIEVHTHVVAGGGKPHASLTVGPRCVWGAVRDAKGWTLCRLPLAGASTLTHVDELPHTATPLVVGDAGIPYGQGVACYMRRTGGGAYVDADLTLYMTGHGACALGDLPSPLLRTRRLTYAEAFACADDIQKNRLRAELTQWIDTLWGAERVLWAADCALHPAEALAWVAADRLLWPTCDTVPRC